MKNSDLKGQFKEEFNRLDYSLEEENVIKEKVFIKYRHNRARAKVIFCVATIMIICLTGVGIVYADEIKDFVRGFKLSTYTKENGSSNTVGVSKIIKEMNYEADIPEVDSSSEEVYTYSISELEDLLDMKILKNDYFKEKEFRQRVTKKVDGKIASADFVTSGSFKEMLEEGFYIQSTHISFVTKYSKDGGKVGWETGSGFEPITCYIKNLDTTAYILTWKDTDKMSIAVVIFIYDNVNYNMFLQFNPRVQREEGVKIIGEFLNGLSY